MCCGAIETRLWASTAFVACLLAATSAMGAPCSGARRLQLSTSQRTGRALLNLSLAQCPLPPACSGSSAAGTQTITPPVSVTLRDAAGHELAGRVNCTGRRCSHLRTGTCVAGLETVHLHRSTVRLEFAAPGTVAVSAAKAQLRGTLPADFTAPLTVTLADAAGYNIEAQFSNCHARRAGTTVAVGCSERSAP